MYRPTLLSILPAVVAILTLVVPAARSAEVPAPDAGARDHVVFLGLSLVLEQARGEEPVVWADRDNIEILRDGAIVKVPRRGSSMKSTLEPRIGRTSVTVDKLKGQRCYSYENHPDRAALGEHLAMLMAQGDAQDAAALERFKAAAALEQIQTANGGRLPASDPALQDAQRQVQTATRALEDSYSNPVFDPDQTDRAPVSIEDNGTGGTFDAFEATFTVSAPRPLKEVVAVLRLFVRDPAQPQVAAPVHKFVRLREIGPEPRRVTITQDRLPRGFAMEEFSLHLFADGRELPSNLAKNRLEVTRAEAHQFLVLQHMQQHRGGNVAVALIPILLAPELRDLIPAGRTDALVDVVVDADGRALEVVPTPPVNEPLPAELLAALRQVAFLPALVKGLPVEGRGTFALGEFAP